MRQQFTNVGGTWSPDEPDVVYLPESWPQDPLPTELGFKKISDRGFSFRYSDDVVYAWRMPKGWTCQIEDGRCCYLHDQHGLPRLLIHHDWKGLYDHRPPRIESVDVGKWAAVQLAAEGATLESVMFSVFTPDEIESLVEWLEKYIEGEQSYLGYGPQAQGWLTAILQDQ